MGKIKVGVIFGGQSQEHEVSISSALSVMKAIDINKFEIIPIGITVEGSWRIPTVFPGKSCALTSEYLHKILDITEKCEDSSLFSLDTLFNLSVNKKDFSFDCIFPVLHGPNGEDGTIQGMLELANIPYVGAGVLASAVGMDKHICKKLLEQANLPVVKYRCIYRHHWTSNSAFIINEVVQNIGLPCFVKPASLGSSVGISKVINISDLPKSIDAAFEYDRKVLVEKAVDCREIECSVLGNDNPTASLPGEIVINSQFYDFEAKYISSQGELFIPAPIDEKTTSYIRQLAIDAYKTIDCSGMARVDFLMEKNSGQIYINELNTIPGFTNISMYPKMWEKTGITYEKLIEKLIDLALERYSDKKKNKIFFQKGKEIKV